MNIQCAGNQSKLFTKKKFDEIKHGTNRPRMKKRKHVKKFSYYIPVRVFLQWNIFTPNRLPLEPDMWQNSQYLCFQSYNRIIYFLFLFSLFPQSVEGTMFVCQWAGRLSLRKAPLPPWMPRHLHRWQGTSQCI